MYDEIKIMAEIAAEGYDAAEKPFDFVAKGKKTALVCVSDDAIVPPVINALTTLGCAVVQAGNTRDALRKMRFHLFNHVVVGENFDTYDPGDNVVLHYLEGLSMALRRSIFVTFVSNRYRTMDNMMAFNKSVNLIVKRENLGELASVLTKAVSENDAFYHVFTELAADLGRSSL